jgi:hypothetical protein
MQWNNVGNVWTLDCVFGTLATVSRSGLFLDTYTLRIGDRAPRTRVYPSPEAACRDAQEQVEFLLCAIIG